ncbi:MAG: MATE family efflux transporter [Oscillospiraceae bacterium]|nr:MATE family efflux transporter [Oscillospiraceae bacterium]
MSEENHNRNTNMQNESRRLDFLTGMPWKRLLRFALPLFLGNIFQQLYNAVDTMIVGRGISHVALAAVGLGAPPLRIVIALFMGVSTGASVLVSQYYGAKNEDLLRRTLHTSLLLAIIVGLALSAIGYTLVPTLLRALNAPDDVFPMARTYLQILFSGLVWQLLYNILSGFMQGLGNSRSPLLILVISSITNAVLTWIFVYPMQLGVAGSAYGTIIAQCLSAVIAIFLLNRYSPMTRIRLSDLKLNIKTTKEILSIGMPAAIQQGVMSLGNMVVMGYISSYGTEAIAGFATGDKVDVLVFTPIMSVSSAITAFTGQNVGAGNMDRVDLGFRHGVSISVIIDIITSAITLIFSGSFLSIFTNDAQTIAEAMIYLYRIIPSYLLMAISQPLGAVMRGSGETVIPMISSLMTVVLVRIPLVALFNLIIGKVEGVYLSAIAAQFFGCIFLLIVYTKGNWRKKALEKINTLQG